MVPLVLPSFGFTITHGANHKSCMKHIPSNCEAFSELCNKIIGERKMQLSRNMAKASVITIVLLMAIFSLMANAPANAQTTYTNMQEGGSMPLPSGVTPGETYPTISYISFRPNPVGLNQPILINLCV